MVSEGGVVLSLFHVLPPVRAKGYTRVQHEGEEVAEDDEEERVERVLGHRENLPCANIPQRKADLTAHEHDRDGIRGRRHGRGDGGVRGPGEKLRRAGVARMAGEVARWSFHGVEKRRRGGVCEWCECEIPKSNQYP